MFTRTWALDALERLAKTFTQVFLAQMIASGLDVQTLTDTSTLQRAGVAAIGAVLSLVFSALSQWSANPGTASLIPEIIAAPPGPLGVSDARTRAVETGEGAD